MQRGRAERGDRLEPLADGLAVTGERHDAPVAAVEAGHRHLVLRAESVEDLPGRPARVGHLPLLAHAAARVHQEQDARRQAPPPVEVGDRLHPPLLVDAELLPPQVGHRPALAVHGGGGKHDEVAPRREGKHLPGGGGREGGQRHDKRRLLQQASWSAPESNSIAAPRGRVGDPAHARMEARKWLIQRTLTTMRVTSSAGLSSPRKASRSARSRSPSSGAASAAWASSPFWSLSGPYSSRPWRASTRPSV